MLLERNGVRPRLAPTASVAASATIVGDVRLGESCYIDHGVVIESSGPPIEIGDEAIILAGSVVRSVGGPSRPAFTTGIGPRTLVAPSCALTGCHIGRNCYIATGVIMLQGVVVGDDVRAGVGAIVHAGTTVPRAARIGMCHVAAPDDDGFVSTPPVDRAREVVMASHFFERAFASSEGDQGRPHAEVIGTLFDEVHGWRDARLG